jgi:hypothetical protein
MPPSPSRRPSPGGSRSPGFADVGNQNFSVRWTGRIMPRFSESYTFKVICDAGARLCFKPTNSVTWTTNFATSPFIVSPTNAQRFYRLRVQ